MKYVPERHACMWVHALSALVALSLAACTDADVVTAPQSPPERSLNSVVPAYAGIIFGAAEDPTGDAVEIPPAPPPDLVYTSITVLEDAVILRARFAPGVFGVDHSRFGFLIDLDQDPATGLPWYDIGAELYLENVFSEDVEVVRLHPIPGGTATDHPVTVLEDGVEVTLPRSAFGTDDGIASFRLFSTNLFAIQDQLPDPGLPAITTSVLTAEDAVTLLEDEIASLVAGGVLSEDQGAGLSDKLDAAAASLARSNPNSARPACNQMTAFVNQVNAFARNGTLPGSTAAELLGAADAIRDEIGC